MLSKELFVALEEAGEDAPVVLFPSGGEASYFHDRADGDWGSYVTEEAIPEAIQRFETSRDRVAIGGISIGGFGALDLGRLHKGRWCAVGAHSPALFRTGADTPDGAFEYMRFYVDALDSCEG